jgi:hypothetical protein
LATALAGGASEVPPGPAAPEPPELAAASERAPKWRWRRFVAVVLATYVAILVGVLAFNSIVDPYGITEAGLLPTAIEPDRTTKLRLIGDLREPPDILILGSSRGRLADPSFLESLTGHDAFNAAVTGGTAADAWVMSRYLADVFPNQPKHYYLWFVDAGIATDAVNPLLRADKRARRYLSGSNPRFRLHDVGTYISVGATRDSLRVVKSCLRGRCRPRFQYGKDGSVPRWVQRLLPEHATRLQKSIAERVTRIRARAGRRRGFTRESRNYFEKTLAFMNSQGARPVIVLNPIHPAILAEALKQGFARQKQGALSYLHRLQQRLDFVVVDCEDIRVWGGSPDDFNNATHVNARNMRRMLRYVVAHSDGALT